MSNLFENRLVITSEEWDNLVRANYGKPYTYQQQDDCIPRGLYPVDGNEPTDYVRDEIPIEVNGEVMGVSFESWKARDPEDKFFTENSFSDTLFWDRNFYPHISMIIQDLHGRGIIPSLEFNIDVDW